MLLLTVALKLPVTNSLQVFLLNFCSVKMEAATRLFNPNLANKLIDCGAVGLWTCL